MTEKEQTVRFVVSNVGYGFAVHDTAKRVANPNTDPDKGPARSTNRLNAPIVEVCTTREKAYALAAELNASDAARG